MNVDIDTLVYLVPIAGIIGLIVAGVLTKWVMRKDTGTPEMKVIGDAIREGAMAYLARQYKTIAIISVIVAVLLVALDWRISIAFLIGAFFSSLSGYIGMRVSVSSNIRTASAARRSLNESLLTSFRGGAVSGLAVVVLSLLGVTGIFFLYLFMLNNDSDFETQSAWFSSTLNLVAGYAFGASFAALFAQLGGGIYTKAADVGADLVGKVEAGIPEDDPRNPAVIADLVGDNVGDCAGRGADLFESTAAENIGAMIMGSAIYAYTGDPLWVFFPLVVCAFGLLASLVGIATVRLRDENEEPMKALNRGYFITAIIAAVGLYFITDYMLGAWQYFVCALIGIVLSIAIVYITQYYTSGSYRPVREIADASETGPATNIITGFSVGLETTVLPIIAIALSLLASYALGTSAASTLGYDDSFIFGLYGTAAATVGMLVTATFVLAMDTFGPITDNAGGIVEMSNQPKEIRNRTDKLDSVGNTTKALTKGYAMGSAALAAFLLFSAFFEQVVIARNDMGLNTSLSEVFHVDIAQPQIFVAALLGAMLVFIFASLAIRAVGKAASGMITEVRRQFKEDPGIMEGTSKPDYASCVDISTKSALKTMVLPAILPVLTPIILGLLMFYAYDYGTDNGGVIAVQAVGAFLMVATIAGILMAILLNNGGGAWDNAKKYIEDGHHGGKGSPAHAAAVVGDTVGDPFKDTAGPSLHVLVKLLSTISLVFAVVFVTGTFPL